LIVSQKVKKRHFAEVLSFKSKIKLAEYHCFRMNLKLKTCNLKRMNSAFCEFIILELLYSRGGVLIPQARVSTWGQQVKVVVLFSHFFVNIDQECAGWPYAGLNCDRDGYNGQDWNTDRPRRHRWHRKIDTTAPAD
jgi:hypothetical protein